MKKKLLLKIGIPVLVVLLLIGGCLIYMCTYSSAVNVDEYFKSSEIIDVKETSSYYCFDNKENNDNALIFYPGAKVDEKAYAQIMYEVAEFGVDCYLFKMPFHMAIFGINKADEVFKNNQYSHYYMSGHSMGGAMAASYVSKTNNKVDGLIFLAAYTSVSLKSKEDLKILSLYGDKDGVLKMKNVEKGRDLVNKDNYKEDVIVGGNHAQFGSYGNQSGDNKANIEREQQIRYTIRSIVEFIVL